MIGRHVAPLISALPYLGGAPGAFENRFGGNACDLAQTFGQQDGLVVSSTQSSPEGGGDRDQKIDITFRDL